MNKKNITTLAIVFFHFFILGQNNCIRVDTVKYSKNTVFLCKWDRLIGGEIFNPEKLIKKTDTAYQCRIYVVRLKDKTENNFKGILFDESPEVIRKYHFKLNDPFSIPCFNDTSLVNEITVVSGWVNTKIKFEKKPGKCKEE
jgi:hypothetical protein